MRKLFEFVRREAVLTAAFVCAAASAFFVRPDAEYIGYIDFRVLCMLFCLMGVVAGLRESGAFVRLAAALLSGEKSVRMVYLALVLLPFFSSMLVTNDVALLTFVPFTLMVLEAMGRPRDMVRIVVLQTVAANLGSMATPVGNPQNLFLFSYYSLGAADFFGTVLPFTALSLLVVVPAMVKTRGSVNVTMPSELPLRPGLMKLCAALFLLCLLAVFRVLDYRILTVICAAALLLADRKLLKMVDWSLLATFVCFFVFSGNLGRMPAVREALSSLMEWNSLLASAAASQVISNVPAAVLLAPMTADWRGLLLGVDLGGLGTPVASLASLISLKLYMASPGASAGRFLAFFSLVNFAGLFIMLAAALMWI